MDPTNSAKSELVDKLKNSNNVLVTVSRDPSVDQLSALLGLTLLLNKQGKHAAAVFSGEVPSTIEFLQPDATIEKNTDSLRDFIIALDKSKADKLRYKVEDNVVRIFITPYKTSISQDDLEFSQGDFNVDIVVAIGVKEQGDLDEAITAHGRILHDAVITSLTTTAEGELGSINWHDTGASSLSEMVTELAEGLDGSLIDSQIATALLTGIVAETARFSNEKTTSQTMSLSAVLMGAGANQQLVASKLSEPQDNVPLAEAIADAKPHGDGTIEIDHDATEDEQPPAGLPAPEPPTEPSDAGADTAGPQIDDVKVTDSPADDPLLPQDSAKPVDGAKIMTEPPEMGGMLTANTKPDEPALSSDVLGMPQTSTSPVLLDHNGSLPASTDSTSVPVPEPTTPADQSTPPAASPTEPPATGDTLTQIETSVNSPHLETPDVNDARDEVTKAMGPTDVLPTGAMEPVAALNAMPMGGELHSADVPPAEPLTPTPPNDQGPYFSDIFNSNPAPAADPAAPTTTPASPDPSATVPAPAADAATPPPVPPPIPFQFGGPQTPTQ